MSHEIVIRPEAEADLAEAKQWYNERRAGLGEDFLLCVDEALVKIARSPELYPVVHKDIRRGVIHRFPFGIFYRINSEQVVVIGVFHVRRAPRHWKSQ
jgi:toxin ParE1/3/4